MNFRIPVAERIIELRKDGESYRFFAINGVVYKVICHKGENLENCIEEMKKKSTLIKVSYWFVEAINVKQAIKAFNEKFFDGSKAHELKACHIDKRRSIIEINCPRFRINSFGQAICGEEVPEMPPKTGKFGFCVLQDRPPLQNCEAAQNALKADKDFNHVRRFVEVDTRIYSIIEMLA